MFPKIAGKHSQESIIGHFAFFRCFGLFVFLDIKAAVPVGPVQKLVFGFSQANRKKRFSRPQGMLSTAPLHGTQASHGAFFNGFALT